MNLLVTWKQPHGYDDGNQWVQTGPDTDEEGIVAGYVTKFDVIYAVVIHNNDLVDIRIDELVAKGWR